MKKLHTIFVIAAIVFFGLIFAAFDNSSPPKSAEKTNFIQSETAQTVHADFDGDIPIAGVRENRTVVKEGFTTEISDISRFTQAVNLRETPVNRRRAEIKTLLEVATNLRTKPKPNDFQTNKFNRDTLTAFKGFGDCNNARAKI